ncbi:hypothetical protein X976_4705 [Burkholderia pseudomallei MSHR7500]|nr:hypothetical protein X976_4705 [Burkholderia pseudomallei MSHR7500]
MVRLGLRGGAVGRGTNSERGVRRTMRPHAAELRLSRSESATSRPRSGNEAQRIEARQTAAHRHGQANEPPQARRRRMRKTRSGKRQDPRGARVRPQLEADRPVRFFSSLRGAHAVRARHPSRFIRGIASCRSRSSIDGHSDWPAKRSARKSTNERTFADTCRRLAYTA